MFQIELFRKNKHTHSDVWSQYLASIFQSTTHQGSNFRKVVQTPGPHLSCRIRSLFLCLFVYYPQGTHLDGLMHCYTPGLEENQAALCWGYLMRLQFLFLDLVWFVMIILFAIQQIHIVSWQFDHILLWYMAELLWSI